VNLSFVTVNSQDDTILTKNSGARECKENTRRTQGEHKEKTGKIV
jgi:hypothetical protein